jgi:hypothetical protein
VQVLAALLSGKNQVGSFHKERAIPVVVKATPPTQNLSPHHDP